MATFFFSHVKQINCLRIIVVKGTSQFAYLRPLFIQKYVNKDVTTTAHELPCLHDVGMELSSVTRQFRVKSFWQQHGRRGRHNLPVKKETKGQHYLLMKSPPFLTYGIIAPFNCHCKL